MSVVNKPPSLWYFCYSSLSWLRQVMLKGNLGLWGRERETGLGPSGGLWDSLWTMHLLREAARIFTLPPLAKDCSWGIHSRTVAPGHVQCSGQHPDVGLRSICAKGAVGVRILHLKCGHSWGGLWVV